MPDREKVIDGLKMHKSGLCNALTATGKVYCPYYENNDNCMIELLNDALALLKEQEAIEPVEMTDDFYPIGDPLRTTGWKCGKCGERIACHDNYCPNCGKAVKWG